MTGVEEQRQLRFVQRLGKISDLSIECRLVEVETLDDLKAELLQDGCHVRRIVLRIVELGCVLIGRVADHEGHPLLCCSRRCNHHEQNEQGNNNRRPYHVTAPIPRNAPSVA